MKRHAIPYAVFPTILCHGIEAIPIVSLRLNQDRFLFRRDIKLEEDRAFHGSYITRFLLIFKMHHGRILTAPSVNSPLDTIRNQ